MKRTEAHVRLEQLGAVALSTVELLQIMGITTGPVALRDLAAEGVAGLRSMHKLTPAVAARLTAAFELGARVSVQSSMATAVFRTPEASARYLLPRYSTRPVETFGVLCLDVRHRLKAEEVVSVGCLTSSLVHPREVFKVAVTHRSAALILFHNHPSGDPEPSAEDISLTRRLVSAGTLMGIEVLDHLVLGAGRHVSLKERGVL